MVVAVKNSGETC